MIGYTTIGVSDLEKSAAFYDALFGVMGVGRIMEFDGYIVWGKGMESEAAGFSICKPYDGNPCTAGNGNMIALVASDKAQVDAVYAKALELGASDEGAPGYRGEAPQGFYAGYFRDMDGNKLNAFCMSPA